MVASRQEENPFYRSFGRHCWRGFGALAQVIGRTSATFVRNYTVTVAKRVGADLLQLAVPEKAEVFSGRRKSGQMQNVWEDTH